MFDKETTWECEGVEIKEIGEYATIIDPLAQTTSVLNLVKFKNLHINKNSKSELVRIPGNSFLATLHHFYHHSVIDMMGTYHMVKKHVPDLKCYFNSIAKQPPVWRKSKTDRSIDSYVDYLKYNPFGFKIENPEINQHEFITDLVSMFSEDGQIYSLNTDNIVFENFYILSDLPTPIAGVAYEATRDFNDLAESLMRFCVEKNSPKKIYISRQKNNLRYKKELEMKKEFSNQANPIIRVYENEKHVEDYFNSIGYVSVTLEGMPMREQLNIFYNATHVAGLNGSGMVNLIASKSKIKVIELDLIGNYMNKFNYQGLYRFKDFDYNIYQNYSNNINDVISGLSSIKDI